MQEKMQIKGFQEKISQANTEKVVESYQDGDACKKGLKYMRAFFLSKVNS